MAQEHYFSAKQSSPKREETLRFIVLNRHFEVKTASGLFSRDQLDHATRTLIESAHKEVETSDLEKVRVLDLGCGWGAVSICLKTALPQISLTAVDTNERAVQITKKNLTKNKLEGEVYVSDMFSKIPEEESTFDYILTNPPYAAGRQVCYSFIEESHAHLNTGGSLLLVARHQKGGKMLESHIKEIFGNVHVLNKSGGFRVYKGIKE